MPIDFGVFVQPKTVAKAAGWLVVPVAVLLALLAVVAGPFLVGSSNPAARLVGVAFLTVDVVLFVRWVRARRRRHRRESERELELLEQRARFAERRIARREMTRAEKIAAAGRITARGATALEHGAVAGARGSSRLVRGFARRRSEQREKRARNDEETVREWQKRKER